MKHIKKIYGYPIDIMHMSIKDRSMDYESKRIDNKVIFVIPAAYTYIKGQDIMLDAILSLPKQYSDQARFLFCGYKVEGQEEYYEKIIKISEKIECVEHLGKLNIDEIYQLYANSDCVIAPSRTDPTPTTIVEVIYSNMKMNWIRSMEIPRNFPICLRNIRRYVQD